MATWWYPIPPGSHVDHARVVATTGVTVAAWRGAPPGGWRPSCSWPWSGSAPWPPSRATTTRRTRSGRRPERFLEAWARSRTATFRSVSDFTRTSHSTGAVLTDRFIVAQRPPDRLSIDGDGATGLVDGRRLACTYRRQQLACQDAPAGRTYEEDVARQIETLRDYVTGDDPLYEVAAEDRDDQRGDCFVLDPGRRPVRPAPGHPGPLLLRPRDRGPDAGRDRAGEADDVTRTVSLEAEVTDAALDPATALDDG